MADTNLKSDAWCMYNQNSAPFFYIFEPGQYSNTYVFGEVGINAAGGTAGSYVRPDVIDISSFLSGRDEMLSKCQPPVPDLDDLEEEKLKTQNSDNSVQLLPVYTREKKSAVELSAIDYNRWTPLDNDPQDLRFILEDMWAQRGGLDTYNYTTLGWNKRQCTDILDPARTCGEFCESVSAYPGVDPLTGQKKSAVSTMGTFNQRPAQEPQYPFVGPYSQNVSKVGANDGCGENYFYGPRYDQGTCSSNFNIDMLQGSAISLSKFPLKVGN